MQISRKHLTAKAPHELFIRRKTRGGVENFGKERKTVRGMRRMIDRNEVADSRGIR